MQALPHGEVPIGVVEFVPECGVVLQEILLFVARLVLCGWHLTAAFVSDNSMREQKVSTSLTTRQHPHHRLHPCAGPCHRTLQHYTTQPQRGYKGDSLKFYKAPLS